MWPTPSSTRNCAEGISAAIAWPCGSGVTESVDPQMIIVGTARLRYESSRPLRGFRSRWRRGFEKDANTRRAKFYRVMNEVPTLLLIVIVIMVIVRPF